MDNYFCTDSVEEQVDYLTDKVTDLNTKKLDKAAVVQATGSGTDVVMSQKAVTDTINESLQTINTEVNGKLTKPANPSAESAVTMLADGTVGTKPLSEIGGGGGGGKSYLHEIKGSYNDGESYIIIKIINTSNTVITDGDGGFFASLVQEGYPAYFRDITSRGVVSVSLEGGGIYRIMGVLNKTNNQTYYVNGTYRFQMFTDTVTEL